MALIGFDSGEATRYPTYAGVAGSWYSVAGQPSPWQIESNNGANGAGVQAGVVYSGTTAFQVLIAGGTCTVGMRRSFAGAPFSESFISLMYQTDANTDKDFFALADAANALSVRLALDRSGRILVYAGTGAGTLKATITTGWSAGTWHSIQIHQNTATNTLELKLDDGNSIDCSGTTMLPWYYLVLGMPFNASGVSANNSYFDCIQVNNALGSVNNSWPGSPAILTALRPNADTASADWTRSGGGGPNGYALINEVSPDLDTTYVASTADGDTSTFGFDALVLPTTNSPIKGICLTAVAKRADAASLIPVISRGGSTPDLSALAKPIGPDYMTPIEWFIEKDPITNAAWTQANINATSFGFKHSV